MSAMLFVIFVLVLECFELPISIALVLDKFNFNSTNIHVV